MFLDLTGKETMLPIRLRAQETLRETMFSREPLQP